MICCVCERTEAETGMVCGPDRNRLRGLLDDIHELNAQLPTALIKTGTAGPKVSGSREAPLPLDVNALDLSMPARTETVTETLVPQVVTEAVPVKVIRTAWVKGRPLVVTEWVNAGQRRTVRDESGRPVMVPAGDQIGHVSVAAVLDSWVRDWIETRASGEHPPVPTVYALHDWLTKRLDWACGHAPMRPGDLGHPAVDAFAEELRKLRGALRATLGLIEPRPERMDRRCPECELLTLIRRPGEKWIDCANPECGRVLSEAEYADYLKGEIETAKSVVRT